MSAALARVTAAQLRLATAHRNATEARARALARALAPVFARAGRRLLEGVALARLLRSGVAVIKERTGGTEAAGFEDELLPLLLQFGLRQLDEAAVLGARQSGMEIGRSFPFREALLVRVVREQRTALSRLRTSTEMMVAATVDRVLADMRDEWPRPTTSEIARRMRQAVDDSGAFSAWRAERVARTELGSITEAGRREGMLVAGVSAHRWVSFGPGRRWYRPNHWDAHGLTVPINQPFRFTGRDGGTVVMMHPKEFGAPAAEVVNCMCTTAPVLL